MMKCIAFGVMKAACPLKIAVNNSSASFDIRNGMIRKKGEELIPLHPLLHLRSFRISLHFR